MNIKQIKFQWLFILVLGMFMASCSDNASDTVDADEYAEEVVFRTQEATNLGKFGCYELVFPITVSFSDASTVEIDSYESFKQAIKDWRTANPDVKTKPTVVFPYEIITKEGEIVSVEDEVQQKELKIACAKDYFKQNGPKGHDGKGKLCFRPAFPYSVALPDGTVITLTSKDDHKALKTAIREWKKNNPGSKERPQVVFPFTVEMEDGTLVTVNNQEELIALKESCN